MENVNSVTTSSEWTQHTTRDGKCFWHNSITNKSTWEKPIELQSDLEHAMSHTPWKEYTAADNKKYWYNIVTKKSVWNCPEEIVNLKNELQCSWEAFENKAVAISRLKTLYRIRGVTTKMKFEEVQNLVSSDNRFALFSCLSAGEKKQALSEYQTQLKKQERDRERSQKSEARKLFTEALNKWKDLSITSLLQDFTSLHADEWWVKLLTVSEREELFDDFVDENKQMLYDKQTSKRDQKKKEILNFFAQNPEISFETRWDDLVDVHLKNFPGILEYEPRDVLQWWEKFVLDEVQKVKDELQQKLNRAQRKKRDAFRDFLVSEFN